MKTTAGLWIDHRKAVIALVSADGEKTLEIKSNVDTQQGRVEGVRVASAFEAQQRKPDDRRERELTEHYNQFYAEVIAALSDAKAVLIFGPGEAKGEFRKRLEHAKLAINLIDMQTTDKMTDRQIAAKAREYYDQMNPMRLTKSA